MARSRGPGIQFFKDIALTATRTKEQGNKRKNFSTCLFSIHNGMHLSCHEQVCLIRLSFKRSSPIIGLKMMGDFSKCSLIKNTCSWEVYNRITWYTLFINNFQINKKAYLQTLKFFTHTPKYLYDPIHIKK